MSITLYKSKVLHNNQLTDKFRFIQLQLQDDVDFSFHAGQFVTIKVGDKIFRSYSISSLSNKLPTWEMLIDISPQGPGTKYLGSLKSGDVIVSTSPRGIFYLQDNPTPSVIMGATGCGIASIKPVMEELLTKNPQHKINLFWGLRFAADIFLKNLFDGWQKLYPNFSYQIILSKPDDTWSGPTGHITEHLVTFVKGTNQDGSIYICGNNDMITDVKKALGRINFPQSQIISEKHY